MTPLNTMLCCTVLFAKENMIGPIFCPNCGSHFHHSPHGHYERYLPDTDELIKVPRFRCRNGTCPRKTFSILPFPCLRYKRHTLAFFLALVKAACNGTVYKLACDYQKGWTSMQRLIRQAVRIHGFFTKERNRQDWGPCPCRDPDRFWTPFTMDQSCATVPDPR